MNAARRSTAGWSLDNVLIDLGGGILSIGPLLQSCLTLDEWSLITGNPIKLGLGLTSIGFDCVFVLQHMVYKGSPATTPTRVDAAWFGELAMGYKACGVLHCPCPCPRCRCVCFHNSALLCCTRFVSIYDASTNVVLSSYLAKTTPHAGSKPYFSCHPSRQGHCSHLIQSCKRIFRNPR